MAKLNHITIEDNYGFGTFYGKKLDADKKLIESINQNYNFPNTSFSKDNIHLISLKQSNATKSIEELLGNEILSLSIKIEDDEHIVNAKTGNFIGVIYDAENNLKIEITSRFGNRFLQHMLNYINNIFIPDISFSSKKDNKKEHSQYQFILAQLFIQSLEKGASIFGLPKIYITQDLHAYKIRGKLNIPDLI
ncbi:MAG TPA: hypothetical protein PKZ66_05600, partial [Chitinophagaceae bacterium]|nr:hypothetical protein [Chitinophagaceae bacterium]